MVVAAGYIYKMWIDRLTLNVVRVGWILTVETNNLQLGSTLWLVFILHVRHCLFDLIR